MLILYTEHYESERCDSISIEEHQKGVFFIQKTKILRHNICQNSVIFKFVCLCIFKVFVGMGCDFQVNTCEEYEICTSSKKYYYTEFAH